MKRFVTSFVAAACLLGALSVPVRAKEPVKLTMGSWRSDDAEQLQKMLDEYKQLTGVEIKFEPTKSAQYNATLNLQLENGTGPDLFYARSYEPGRQVYEAGYMMDCSDIPGVKENFTEASLQPWTAKDGKIFAVPLAAVSHVVYYNKKVFEENKIEVPKTFEEFLDVCKKLKEAGKQPLANGIASDWDILECVFLGMLPNYVGGPEERAKYEKGELKMNDEAFKNALTDFQALCAYLPEGFESVSNDDGPSLLGTDQAVMFIDGSWTCGMFDGFGLEDWGAFAIPPREGKQAGMCFHPDCGITGNTKTKHPEEVKAFLAWMAKPEGVEVINKYLPKGFFPMIKGEFKYEDQRVTDLLALNTGKTLDTRFIWPHFLDLYKPMLEDLNAMTRGGKKVDEVADHWAKLQEECIAKEAEKKDEKKTGESKSESEASKSEESKEKETVSESGSASSSGAESASSAAETSKK